MALLSCPSCGKQVSDQAVSCPNCGHHFGSRSVTAPQKAETKGPGKGVLSTLGGGIILIIILAIKLGGGDHSGSSIAEPAQVVSPAPIPTPAPVPTPAPQPATPKASMTDLNEDEQGFEVSGITNHTCHSGATECRAMLCEYTNHTGQPAQKMLIVYKLVDGKTPIVQSEMATLKPGEPERRYTEVASPDGDQTKYGCTTRDLQP